MAKVNKKEISMEEALWKSADKLRGPLNQLFGISSAVPVLWYLYLSSRLCHQ